MASMTNVVWGERLVESRRVPDVQVWLLLSGALGLLVDGPVVPLLTAKARRGAVQPGVAGDDGGAHRDGEEG
ncbi:MAG: hypothetical protein JSV81_20470, partial [Anaerolineales bacterium]